MYLFNLRVENPIHPPKPKGQTMNGHETIAFHLDRRLTKLEARWKTIQLLMS